MAHFMNNIQNIINVHIATVQQLFSDLPLSIRSSIDISLNTDPQRQSFGDLSSNAALLVAKYTGKHPRTVAAEIIAATHHPFIASQEIAGPGFINITLTHEAFHHILRELRTQKYAFFALQDTEPRERYCVEFISANPTGPLHIGHGRNGIIGDMLCRITTFLGHETTAEFYCNDAGAQMTKLGISLKIRCQQLCGYDASIPEDGYHGEYLIPLAERCIAAYGPTVIEERDIPFFSHYAEEQILAEQKETIALYRVHFNSWFSERTLHTSGAIAQALEKLRERGHLYDQDGAIWLRTTAFGDDKDRVVQRSSGEYTYVAADIAYLENKVSRGFTKIITVLGQDHHSYLTRLKAVIEALGHDPAMLDIILYQLVMIKNEGELLKLSKRAGRIIGLRDIIEAVGPDVARFFYLNRKADAHLEFNMGLALKRTEENPVFYIQYAYVRTGSILEKGKKTAGCEQYGDQDIVHLSLAEHIILKKIVALHSLLRYIAQTYQTHMLAYYILELSHIFHSYYAAHRVIDPDNIPLTRARLVVVEQLRETIKLCLTLLGLDTPQSM